MKNNLVPSKFQSQESSPLAKPKIGTIITDWDDTVTTEDTIRLVAESAYITNPTFPHPWSYFSDIYMASYKNFTNHFGSHDTIEKEIEFQKGLREVELSSVSETIETGLFKGVKVETLKKQAEKVKIRKGFWDFLEKTQALDIQVIILSVNWTSHIIRATLNNQGFYENDNLKIIVNEFEFDTDGKCTGYVFKNDHDGLRTGYDKLKVTKNIINERKLKNNNGAFLYIGDSSTDVLSMVESDVAIIVEGGSATKTLERLGFSIDSLSEGLKENDFYKVTDWEEIKDIL